MPGFADQLLSVAVIAQQGCTANAEGAGVQVDLILALTRNVTGIKLNAFFAPIMDGGEEQPPARRQGFLWQRADGFGHVVRRWIIRRAPGRAPGLG